MTGRTSLVRFLTSAVQIKNGTVLVTYDQAHEQLRLELRVMEDREQGNFIVITQINEYTVFDVI